MVVDMPRASTSVLMAGFGWIGAGIVSFATWYTISIRVSTGFSNPSGMLYLSVLVTIVGILVLVFRRKIDRIVEEKETRQSPKVHKKQ
ncbi:conserved hypothetical protein, membrane [mine drainage metagenome]|uniref:Uncharacterized protein n=1 Tax=mine drainage metagenome TaxID=410659 RepID=T1A7S7_9ZZZZ